MKYSDIKQLPSQELQEKASQMRSSYTEMKMTHAVTPLENPMQLRNTRRTIARIETELTKRAVSR